MIFSASVSEINLSYGILFDDFYNDEGLLKIDNIFLDYLFEENIDLYKKLTEFRKNNNLDDKILSQFLIDISPYFENFISNLFNIKNDLEKLYKISKDLSVAFDFKRNFVQKIVSRKLDSYDYSLLPKANLMFNNLNIQEFVIQVLNLLDENSDNLIYAEIFVANILKNNPDKFDDVFYYLPKKIDFITHKIQYHKLNDLNIITTSSNLKCTRKEFELLDKGADIEYVIDQTNYCIFCHKQGKDSCRKGLKENKGCPLEERISEMNLLKNNSFVIAPLAVAMIDNPLLAATGHRICNDCMKSCIYQKQEPVDIPQIESRVLKDVLNLPFGFEIYSLLTRWNPLNINRPLPRKNTGKKVLVVGLGPAGFNLTHHLLNDGHDVVAIDGLKIEPMLIKFEPIKNIESFFVDLNERIPYGFGGVAEYGITHRWNKNYLTLIYLLMHRRKNCKIIGGVRFGSNITKSQAYELGFSHIALCIGAGKPNLLNIDNGMAKGIRTASDFLMSLQLSGAFNNNINASLNIRLPIIVVGGGLTAIDAATESLFFYQKTIRRICNSDLDISNLDDESKEILLEYKDHYNKIKDLSQEDANKFLADIGGSAIIYRKNLFDSPAWRLNSEEVEIALSQNIKIIESAEITEILLDKNNAVEYIKVNDHKIPARTILIAAGTVPNTTLTREFPGDFSLSSSGFIKIIDAENKEVIPQKSPKPEQDFIFTEINKDNTSISVLGDAHPSYAGNVVKAMAGSKRACPLITQQVMKTENKGLGINEIEDMLTATIHDVKRLTPNIIEIVVKSYFAAQNFKPGQFFRLQNFISNSNIKDNKIQNIEPLALTGSWVDKSSGLISLIILEMGKSSKICANLKIGEKICLMGPTGSPTYIPNNKNILLIGGGLGNAVLFSVASALKSNGCNVTYIAGYKNIEDRYKIEMIEEYADQIIWCADNGILSKNREQDFSYNANIIKSIELYSNEKNNKLHLIDECIVIGSDKMMAAVAYNLKNNLKNMFPKLTKAVSSVNSPMQCMMKEICAQCIQEHIDENGNKYYVYSCVDQDQNLFSVNFQHLESRLNQNKLQECL